LTLVWIQENYLIKNSKGKKDPETSSGQKKPVQVKLKINLWTVAGIILVIFFVLPIIITGLQMVWFIQQS